MVMASLRNKRFQLNYCAKVGNSKKMKEGGVGGEKNFLFSPPPSPFIPIFLRPSFLNEIAQERLLRRLVMVRFEKHFTKFPDNTVLAS